MTIKEILQNFTEFYECADKDGTCNLLDDPDLGKAIDEAQAVLDKGLTCASCKYNQDDLTDGRPCACLTCALSYLTPEQQKHEINHEAY